MLAEDNESRSADVPNEVAALREALRAMTMSLRCKRSPDFADDRLPPECARLLQPLIDEVADVLKSRRLFDEAVDMIRDGFAMFDPDLRLLHANRSFRGFFGDLIRCDVGVNLRHLIDEFERHNLVDFSMITRQGFRDQMVNSHGVPSIVRFADGRKFRWFSKRDSRGNLICLASDVTAELDRQQQLAEARQLAERAAEAKSRFLTHTSHELRTPLNGILGMAELLCDNGLAGENRLFAEIIRGSAEALLSIINDVLDYARGQAQEDVIREVEFDLEGLAADTITLLLPNAAAKGLRLQLSYDPLTPTAFLGDAGRIRQIILNLVGNAIKYTPKGQVSLNIVSQRDGVAMVVEDTGPGIPDHMADAIFDEFRQLEEHANDEQSGSGLGLAITSQLVGTLQGRLWQTSQHGSGASFGTYLPLITVSDCAVVDPSEGADDVQVILIGPEPGFARRLQRKLRAAGRKVLVVRDANEAAALPLQPGVSVFLMIFDDNQIEPPDLAMQRLQGLAGRAQFWLVANALGQRSHGSTFCRVLHPPLTRRALETAIVDAMRGMTHAEDGICIEERRRMCVLTADDNATNRLIIEKMLRDCDIELVSASDGQEAVNSWRQHRPDLILMDLSMPFMDGRAASRMIRQIELQERLPRTSIIAVTAEVLERDVNSIAEAGINDIMVKPVRRAQLIELISRYAPRDALPPVSPNVV